MQHCLQQKQQHLLLHLQARKTKVSQENEGGSGRRADEMHDIGGCTGVRQAKLCCNNKDARHDGLTHCVMATQVLRLPLYYPSGVSRCSGLMRVLVRCCLLWLPIASFLGCSGWSGKELFVATAAWMRGLCQVKAKGQIKSLHLLSCQQPARTRATCPQHQQFLAQMCSFACSYLYSQKDHPPRNRSILYGTQSSLAEPTNCTAAPAPIKPYLTRALLQSAVRTLLWPAARTIHVVSSLNNEV